MQTVTLSLYRFGPVRDRLWVFGQMGLARRTMARLPGCTFWKLCGSGSGAGFSPRPETAVWAILAAWESETAARRAIETRPHASWDARAEESYTLTLAPTSVRGAWNGSPPFAPGDPASGPIAVLTRGTIRPRALRGFWSAEPPISERVAANEDMLLGVGIGEVPWLHQITFSVWPDTASMTRFARSGPHAEAIARVRKGGWFAEELYARFHVVATRGTWGGIDPIAPLVSEAA